MGPCRYLLPPTRYFKLNCTVGAYRPVRNNSEREVRNGKGNGKMNSADLCNRAPISTALGIGPAQEPQKLKAFKVCVVHSKPLFALNSDLHSGPYEGFSEGGFEMERKVTTH